MRYRRSIIKWFFLAGGLLMALVALRPSLATFAHGVIAGGCFIAFALMDALDRLAPLLGERKNNPPPAP